MASSSSSSSSSSGHSSDDSFTTAIPKCLLILPFSISPPPPPLPFSKGFIHASIQPSPSKPNLLCHLRSSIVSTARRCLGFILSHDHSTLLPALLNNLFSFSSHFPNFCHQFQIHYGSYRSLNTPYNHNFAAILPGDSVAGVVVANGILNFLNIYNTLLIVRLVLTWFPNSPPAIVSPLSTLCDPYLNIFRGIIPPLGGTLDLSPILAFLVLNAFTSTAAALPAELPSTGVSQEIPSSSTTVSHLTTSQKKWMRRIAGNRSKSSGSDN